MRITRAPRPASIFGRAALLFALALFAATSARANVYATDVKINGGFSNVTNSSGSTVTISYILNQPATAGVTVNILLGSSVVASVPGTTNLGLNSVTWITSNAGLYDISVTAAATGFPVWTQISSDTNAGNYAFDPNGMAVDCNTYGPYYGRVVVGCSSEGGTNPVTQIENQDGIYKYNADGSPADEGVFGYGQYTTDDRYDSSLPQSQEMPSESGSVPWLLRIGADDRVYMLDFSADGAVCSFDMQVTNQFKIVINEGTFNYLASLDSSNTFAGNPDISDLSVGIGVFDVTTDTNGNGAVWLCDSDSPPNSPNWGIWAYHMVNGASDPADTIGIQAVTTGGDLSIGSTGGCTVDSKLDIFCAQSPFNETAAYYGMVFTNWNKGVLPPESTASNSLGPTSYADGGAPGQVAWGFGCSIDTICATNPTFEAVVDSVINSRSNPTLVAYPMVSGADEPTGLGIRVLNALNATVTITNATLTRTNLAITCASSSPSLSSSQLSLLSASRANGPYTNTGATFTGGNGVYQATAGVSGSAGYYVISYPTTATAGSIVTVQDTNGNVIQSLTNIDFGQTYTCAAWDNVGNLYGASTSRQVWRVWSPPGANTSTTPALASVRVRNIVAVQPAP